MIVDHTELIFETRETNHHIDITEEVKYFVKKTGITFGSVIIQSMHTTARVFENENEPGLIEDFKRHLEIFSPMNQYYQHDDFNIRTVNMCADECANGHAHIKSIFLPTSITLIIIDNEVCLGEWQRIFLWEFDRARLRKVQIMASGICRSKIYFFWYWIKRFFAKFKFWF